MEFDFSHPGNQQMNQFANMNLSLLPQKQTPPAWCQEPNPMPRRNQCKCPFDGIRGRKNPWSLGYPRHGPLRRSSPCGLGIEKWENIYKPSRKVKKRGSYGRLYTKDSRSTVSPSAQPLAAR